jgi:hypothetical protein
MKNLVAAILGTALAVCIGCNQTSPPGGPGANKPDNKTVTGAPKGETFTIKTPAGSTEVKQGDKKEITIPVNRAKDFKQDVKLTFASDDKGVTVTPDTHTLKASDSTTDIKFTVEASKDAAIGEHNVNVKATPESGPPTEATFKIKVTGP